MLPWYAKNIAQMGQSCKLFSQLALGTLRRRHCRVGSAGGDAFHLHGKYLHERANTAIMPAAIQIYLVRQN